MCEMKLGIILILSLALLSASVRAEEILELSYSPEKPLVGQEIAITVLIRNPSDELKAFNLKFFILKDSLIEYNTTIELELGAGRLREEFFRFTPEDIGRYNIYAELWDKYFIKRYDSGTIELNVKSEIGPFDISLDLLTRSVYPGSDVPAILTVINKGAREVDVTIQYRILETEIFGSFSTALKPDVMFKRAISLISPERQGLYTLRANVLYDNEVIVSSAGQFLVSPLSIPIYIMSAPRLLEIESRHQEDVGILVKNFANVSVHDLKLVVKGIPLDWAEITPSSLDEVEPEETRAFMINIKVPEDAEPGEYIIDWIASSHETTAKESSTLKITEYEEKIPMITYLLLIMLILPIILIIRKATIRIVRSRRYDMLRMIRSSI